ncbi:MAG: hypothetical protein KDA52_18040, partial [Planctomycetaceae bacterium]|nr:hypothetical protein [Planctomycetaceae bacterium]
TQTSSQSCEATELRVAGRDRELVLQEHAEQLLGTLRSLGEFQVNDHGTVELIHHSGRVLASVIEDCPVKSSSKGVDDAHEL